MNYNKRANTAVSIVILVVLILVLSLAVLFMFQVNGKKDGLTINTLFIEKSIYEKLKAESQLKIMAEQSYLEAYSELAREGRFSDQQLNEKFETILFPDILRAEMNFEAEEQLKENVRSRKISSRVDGNNIILDSGEIVFASAIAEKDDEKVFISVENVESALKLKTHSSVFYRTNITINISAEKLGLVDLGKLSQIRNKCMSEENRQDCIRKNLEGFIITQIDNEIYAESERFFAINGEKVKIRFKVL